MTNFTYRVVEAERERWLENRSHLRGERVRDMLAGEETNIDRASVGLGYPLRVTHLGLVVWFGEHDGPPIKLPDLERAARAVAESFGIAADPLFVVVDRVSGFAWIPLRDAIPSGQAVTAGGRSARRITFAGDSGLRTAALLGQGSHRGGGRWVVGPGRQGREGRRRCQDGGRVSLEVFQRDRPYIPPTTRRVPAI